MNQKRAVSDLSAHIEMGLVELNVLNLRIMKHYYSDLAGLQVISETDSNIVLGYNERPILHLILTPNLSHPLPDDAGLYHTAILYESRAGLSKALKNILLTAAFLYSGSADHKVSEAFYFSDPEGNGVELYFDKDPSTWEWKDGQVVMGSEYIDIKEYISSNEKEKGSPAMKTGHIHLKVGNIITRLV